MKTSTAVLLGLGLAGVEPPPRSQRPPGANPASMIARQASTDSPAADAPIEYVENLGQWPEDVRFAAILPGAVVRAEPGAIGIQLTSAGNAAYVRLVFDGSDPAACMEGLDQRPGLRNWFLGNDSSKWVRNARSYSRVMWRDIYPGVDLVLRTQDGRLKYDLLLAPGIDVACVRIRCEGVLSTIVNRDSGALIETEAGSIEQPLGRCWQELDSGETRPIGIRCRSHGEHSFGFELIGHDPTLPTVVDPSLLWSTYFGGPYPGSSSGSVGDRGEETAYDAAGDVYVTGEAEWPGFPTTPGAFQHPGTLSGFDAFVAKFSGPTGALIYSSVIGGNGYEPPLDLAVDSTGRALIAGTTVSTDFPTTPASFDIVKNAYWSGFVLRLSAAGDDLEFSTFLEGTTSGAIVTGVDTALSGSIIVGGEAYSQDFPTTPGAFDTTYNPWDGPEGFVTRIDPSGSFLEWSTFLAGWGGSRVRAVAIGQDQAITAAGDAGAAFPITPGAYQQSPSAGSGGESFVTRLAPDGTSLIWSTYFGGPGNGNDIVEGVALLPGNDVVLAGITPSASFPTTSGAFQTQWHPPTTSTNHESFVTRMKADGSALVYSTYLGSSGDQRVSSLDVDRSGLVTVAGTVESLDFPTTPGAFDTTFNSAAWEDAFVARLDPTLGRLLYCSYFGGENIDFGRGVGMSRTGRTTLIGYSRGDYPTTPGTFPYAGGQYDAVVTTFDPVLEGVEIAGTSLRSCLGPLNLNADPMPVAGEVSFRLYCSQAPPNASGALAVWSPGSTSIRPTQLVPARPNDDGWVETAFPLAGFTAGEQLRFRYFFRNTPMCTGPTSVALSNLLLVTVQ